jgi:hypothetical protein
MVANFDQVLAWRSDFKFDLISWWLRPSFPICRKIWCDSFYSTKALKSFRHNEVIVGHTVRFKCENRRSYSLNGMAVASNGSSTQQF